LEDDLLAVRVLSFWNLKDITGAGLHYRPEDPPVRRATSARYWEERRKKNEIRLKRDEEKGAGGGEEPLIPGPPR
jgi:hypothetical protein